MVEKKDFESAIKVSNEINTLNSNLLIQQSKKWIDNSNFAKFSNIFSCNNESDILAEFFFLISNFLAVDENFEKSSFYSNISNYLNTTFTELPMKIVKISLMQSESFSKGTFYTILGTHFFRTNLE